MPSSGSLLILSEKRKIQLKKLLTIIVAWVTCGIIISIYDHFILYSQFSRGPSLIYEFHNNLIINIVAGLMSGIMGGSVLVFYINEKMRDRPYLHSILMVCFAFIVIVSIVILFLGIIYIPLATGKPLLNPASYNAYLDYIMNPLHLKNIVVWSIVVGFTQLFLQINNKFGHGILWDIIRGKYHSPRDETRIFMFVDIKSSTSIAERLGNKQYYNLLRDFYADITDPVIYNKGEIYQYVGDEVVISWKMENGIENNQCLKCYFDMAELIRDKKEKYLSKYGLIPEFKAGLHFGNVTAGEIGIIKRDITFSGDVLNTTSRIQNQCNHYNVHLLASADLIKLLKPDGIFEHKPIGSIQLKGKKKLIELCSLTLIPA